jgi:YVTN family beta-propeller protein
MKKIIIFALPILLTVSCKKKEEPIIQVEEPTVAVSKTISVGSGPDAMFLFPDNSTIYVANVEDTTISIIDVSSETVIGEINGIRYPWGFSKLSNSNEVAVSAYDKQLAIIDFTSNTIVRQTSFNSTLGGIVADQNGQFIYVVAIDSSKVYKIDAQNLTITDSFDTGDGPDGVGISANFDKLYVTNTADGTISIIQIASGVTTILNTGGKPELIHSNTDNSLLFISNFNNNKVHILNTFTDVIDNEITGLDGPEEAVVSGDKLYVVNFNSKKVFQYNSSDYSKDVIEYDTGLKPIGILEVNNKLYVTNYGDNNVSVITK